MAYYSAHRGAGSSVDFYKILRVPHTATLAEIKTSYRKLALRLHPDLHKNDVQKTMEFKLVSEAYTILSDTEKKNAYDFSVGNRFNRSHRRTAPPPNNYRKVYTSQAPPPSWNGRTWNHDLHYNMHYGTGMRDEAIRQAKESARKQGVFDYHSPLGKGFSFSSNGDPRDNINPYSKHSVQGPRTVTFEYEEGYQDAGNKSGGDGGKQFVQRRDKIVEDLHGRREERHFYEAEQRRQRQRSNSPFRTRGMMTGNLNSDHNINNNWSGTSTATATAGNDCVIL
jgi:curved DNA-binding protein CbpA